MRIARLLHCFSLVLVMLCAEAQDPPGQCTVADRYRVRCIGLLYNLVSCGLDRRMWNMGNLNIKRSNKYATNGSHFSSSLAILQEVLAQRNQRQEGADDTHGVVSHS